MQRGLVRRGMTTVLTWLVVVLSLRNGLLYCLHTVPDAQCSWFWFWRDYRLRPLFAHRLTTLPVD